MSDKVYFVDSVSVAIEHAQYLAMRRCGHFGRIRKVNAEEIIDNHRTVRIQIQVNQNRIWFEVALEKTSDGWVVQTNKKEKEMKQNVIRVLVQELAPLCEDDPKVYEILIWPDGLITDLSGQVMEWTGNGRLAHMVRPFKGRRSLKGICILNKGEKGTGLVWTAHNPEAVSQPQFPSQDGEDHYYYYYSPLFEATIDQMPERPETLPICDAKGNEYPIKFEEGYMYVLVGDDWVASDHTKIPETGDTVLLEIAGCVVGAEVVSIDWPFLICEYEGKKIEVYLTNIKNVGISTWLAFNVIARWSVARV